MDENTFVIPFSDISRLLIRGLPVALGAAAIIGAASYFLSFGLEKSYEARATVLAANSSPDVRSLGVITPTVPSLDVSAYRKAVSSGPVSLSAMQALGNNEQNTLAIEAFQKNVKIHTEAGNDSSLIDIIIRDASPQLAQNKANALANALVNWDRGRATLNLQRIISTLEQQVSVQNAQIESLRQQGAAQDQIDGRITIRAQQQDQLAYARALSTSATGLLIVIEPALLPVSPVAPRPVLNALIAFVLTLIISYALLHLRNSLKETPEDFTNFTKSSGLSVLASLPKSLSKEDRPPTESINFLRTNLLFSPSEGGKQVILVSSPQDDASVSKIATSLAENFVRNNSHTLLVDGNLRMPGIADIYAMPASLNHASFEAWLAKPEQTRDVVKVPISKQPLYVIPSFASGAEAAERLSRFKDVLASWKKEYDVIIIAGGPVLKVADTLSIAPYCTDTVLVVDEQEGSSDYLRSAIESLQRLGVKLAGMVVTNAKKDQTYFADTGTYKVDPKLTSFGSRR